MKLRAKSHGRPSIGATTLASCIALAVTLSVISFSGQAIADLAAGTSAHPVCMKALPID
ncbi:MAG: hypothetical protein JJ850_10410 [Kordiimonadaceae bacterium]|nr:hypothetical protein [Kordiimonadaceae bacterium]MBO6569547.1 hypothetical protein [Kordiimonadaceae bacterium]MBO6965022.1 hypothetical protein [Kordiimonadaceae bacterium]